MVSKAPSFRWETGMLKGRSSERRTVANEESAEVMADSGRWKAGEREEIREGVRRRTLGFVVLWLGLWCGWLRGRSWRRGRKACVVIIGVKSRVLRRSERVEGGRAESGREG